MIAVEHNLAKKVGCLLCLPNNQEGVSKNLIQQSKDHIVPRVAIKDHHEVFDPIVASRINKIRVCRLHHDEIDNQKIKAYMEEGPIGLVNFLANYPRAVESRLLVPQYYRWIRLFKELYQSFTTAPARNSLRSRQYQDSAIVVGNHVVEWEIGGFDAFVSLHLTRETTYA